MKALGLLRTSKGRRTAEIKEHHLSDLLREVLQQLVIYFKENPQHVREERGDKLLLTELETQLSNHQILLPDIVKTLQVNMDNIDPDCVGIGLVYPTFKRVLVLPCFQVEDLWKSDACNLSNTKEALSKTQSAMKEVSQADRQRDHVRKEGLSSITSPSAS